MLELRAVSKHFRGIPAIDSVSFQARAGEITGYLGPNGSGKSTTMKMITGLLTPTSGEILFRGERIDRDWLAFKQRLGYVPEEPHLYTHLSGLEHLLMAGQLRGLGPRLTALRVDGLLQLLALHADRHVPISYYSKGMRQKVLLAAALLHNPDLILLDEPFSGLDVNGAHPAQPDSGTGCARQSHPVQLARTRNRRARLLARSDPAPRETRGRRFRGAPPRTHGCAEPRSDLLAIGRAGPPACRSLARHRGSDGGLKR